MSQKALVPLNVIGIEVAHLSPTISLSFVFHLKSSYDLISISSLTKEPNCLVTFSSSRHVF